MTKEVLGREEDHLWFQRDPTVTKDFSHEKQKQEAFMRAVLFPSLSAFDLIVEHLYDEVTHLENIIIKKTAISSADRYNIFISLGWKEKKVASIDQQERNDFYDAMLKGGTMH